MRVPGAVAALLLLLAGGHARAEPGGGAAAPDEDAVVPAPYHVRWSIDGPVLIGALAAWGLPALLLDETVAPACPCDPAELNPLDRWVAGRRSDRIASASDRVLEVTLGATFAATAIDARRAGAGWSTVADDVVVIGQSLAVSGAVTQLVKQVTRRPRPLAYGAEAGDPVLEERDTYLSFFSAHTGTTIAAGLAFAGTYARRHPRSRWRHVLYGGAVGLGATAGLLRILSGRHFPTDVATGAAVGSLAGVGVPWLHDRRRSWAVTVAPADDGAVVLVAGSLP